ncbi:MAG: hypothetical protein AAF556_06120, partial [Pseudomonadota bacterium]
VKSLPISIAPRRIKKNRVLKKKWPVAELGADRPGTRSYWKQMLGRYRRRNPGSNKSADVEGRRRRRVLICWRVICM